MQVSARRGVTASRRSPSFRKGSVADVVVALLESQPTITRSQVTEALKEVGNFASDESVASALSRMLSRGLITKAGRGVYGRPRPRL